MHQKCSEDKWSASTREEVKIWSTLFYSETKLRMNRTIPIKHQHDNSRTFRQQAKHLQHEFSLDGTRNEIYNNKHFLHGQWQTRETMNPERKTRHECSMLISSYNDCSSFRVKFLNFMQRNGGDISTTSNITDSCSVKNIRSFSNHEMSLCSIITTLWNECAVYPSESMIMLTSFWMV